MERNAWVNINFNFHFNYDNQLDYKHFSFSFLSLHFVSSVPKMWMSVLLERLSVANLQSVSTLRGVTCASVLMASLEMEKAVLVSKLFISIHLLVVPLFGLSFF